MLSRQCLTSLFMSIVIWNSVCAGESAGTQPTPTSQTAPASQPVQPVVHLLAPSAEYAAKFDCLVPETALRLTVIDLAARQGQFARFWPVDQLGQVPADAYPRVQISHEALPPMPHLKLVRKGDTFFFLASADGKEYLSISHVDAPMSAAVSVGLFAPYDPQGKPFHAKARNLRLNGQPIDSPQAKAVGRPLKPSKAQPSQEEWVIDTYGMQTPSQNDRRERGEFLCVPAEGDFELSATIEIPTGEDSGCRGFLMCRDGLGVDAPMVGLSAYPEGAYPVSRIKPYRYMRCHATYDTHVIRADLLTSPDKSRRIASTVVSCGDWSLLTRSIEVFASQIRTGLEKISPAGSLAPATPATAAQLAQLDQARELALKVCSRDVLAASRKVDAVLNEAALCPQAHYTAGLCGAILACQDLYGRFHERGRFLAGPLSHWMYARRLAEPARMEDRLDGAWVMLACGYPDAALSHLGELAKEQTGMPEIAALRIFVTRDYRPEMQSDSQKTPPIEGLALLWATQHCGREDLLREECSELLEETRSPAFSTLYESADFSAPAQAISMAYSRDANDLLRDERIPAAKRVEVGTAMAECLRVMKSEDPAELGRSIAWQFQQVGYALQATPNQSLSDAFARLVDLYDAAMATPAGPVLGQAGLRWQSLSPHDFAELQRGLLLLTVFVQAKSMGYSLGVPQQTHDFCQAIAKGLEGFPGADAYFQGYGQIMLGQYDKALEQAKRLLRSRFGKTLSVRCMLVLTWDGRAVPDYGQRKIEPYPGRGAWQWAQCADASMWDGYVNVCEALAWQCLRVDPYASWPLNVLIWKAQTPEVTEPLRARMPYSLTVLRTTANAACRYNRPYTAIDTYRKIIELMPRDANGYYSLAEQYAATGDLDKAIEVAREADKKCEFSILLTNLLGRAAGWLVQQNRPEEALEFGRKSARSYSYLGLQGLAVALVANKKIDEAQDIYRRLAHRYHNGTIEYVRFLLEQHRDQAFIDKEITALLREHTQIKDAIAGYAGKACCQACADPAVLEGFYAGALSFYQKDWQQHKLLECAMYARQFDKAVEYGMALHNAKQLTVYERMWLHAAMRLSDKKEGIDDVQTRLLSQINEVDISPHVRYLLGQVTWKELREASTSAYLRSYAFWLRGIEAELRHDLPAAVEAYDIACDTSSDGDAPWLSYHWRHALSGQLAAATQRGAESAPAASPAAAEPSTPAPAEQVNSD